MASFKVGQITRLLSGSRICPEYIPITVKAITDKYIYFQDEKGNYRRMYVGFEYTKKIAHLRDFEIIDPDDHPEIFPVGK